MLQPILSRLASLRRSSTTGSIRIRNYRVSDLFLHEFLLIGISTLLGRSWALWLLLKPTAWTLALFAAPSCQSFWIVLLSGH
jgi:hypothetical protein